MTQTATFGNGCFWCTEAIFQRVNGVESVVSGYSGGSVANPTYEQVCTGTTGHAEVVQITFDSDLISYEDLVRVFFATHDPTTLNRQGNDVGTQYRSAIFYHGEQQREVAEKVLKELDSSGTYPAPIVTQVVPFEIFYPGETYHQNFFNEHTNHPYCSAVIGPKVQKFLKSN